jgi:hypothetical protein
MRYQKFNKYRNQRYGKKLGGRYAAFLPQNAFVGHRGLASGNKNFSHAMRNSNPRNPETGKPLECLICGSLRKECPHGGGPLATTNAHFGRTAALGGSCESNPCGSCYSRPVGHLFTHGVSQALASERRRRRRRREEGRNEEDETGVILKPEPTTKRWWEKRP